MSTSNEPEELREGTHVVQVSSVLDAGHELAAAVVLTYNETTDEWACGIKLGKAYYKSATVTPDWVADRLRTMATDFELHAMLQSEEESDDSDSGNREP